MSETYLSDAEKVLPCLRLELAEKMGLEVTKQDLSRFHFVQFGIDELKRAADEGFILVAMPLINLRQLAGVKRPWRWNEYMGALASVYEAEGGWFNVDLSRKGYMLFRPTPLEITLGRNWHDQLKVLPDNWEVPPTVEVVYALMAMVEAGLAPDRAGMWMRTRDEGAFSLGRVIVALKSTGQVEINFDEDDHNHRDVGLAVAKQARW